MNLAPALPAGYRLAAFEALPSTNDEAARRAREGEAGGLVVWARRQTAGRGRYGRPWTSPEGNLSLSILLRPSATTPAAASQLSFVTAVAVAEMVGGWLGDRVRIKWPNDVLAAGGKVAGILLEAAPDDAGNVDWVIVGTGVNLVAHPPGTETPATDVLAQSGAVIPVETAVTAYLAAFDGWYRRWRRDGFDPIRAAWLASAAGQGGEVRVRLPRETFTGRFVGLDESGALVVETAPGTRRLVAAGDVFALGATG